jgi:hypothetical protein
MTASAKRPRGDGPSTEARLTGLLGIQTGHRPARCGSSGSSSDARRRKRNESKETMTDKMVTMPPDVWRLSGKISKPFRWFTVLSKDKWDGSPLLRLAWTGENRENARKIGSHPGIAI